jgi:hypothetical protein
MGNDSLSCTLRQSMFNFLKNERALCFANEDGIVPLALLVAVFGVVSFLVISSVTPFGGMFSKLYPKPASHAASGIVDLSLSPAQVTVSQNGTFNLDVVINAKTDLVSAASVQVNFDPAVLQATSVTAGSFLPIAIVPGAVGSGTASITLGANPGSPVSGNGTLAVITFKALQNTTTSVVSFDTTNTQVAVIGLTGNQVGSLSSANVVVGSSSTPTPLPTSSPTPIPTVSSSPIPTPTANASSYILEAELMSLIANSGAIQVFNDGTASGGSGLLFFSNATSNGTLVSSTNTSQIVIRAKGDQCQGAPTMTVKVDNITVQNKLKVSNTSWTDYPVSRAVTAGTHTVSVTFNNDYIKTKGGGPCDRNLRVDKITFQ